MSRTKEVDDMTDTTTKVLSDKVVQQVIGELMAKDYGAWAAKMQTVLAKATAAGEDPNAAMTKFTASLATKEVAKREKVAKAEAEKVEKSKGAVDAFLARASDVLGKAWRDAKLVDDLNAIDKGVLKSFSFVVARDQEKGTVNEPITIKTSDIKARVKGTSNGDGGKRGEPLTVDGTEYATAKAAGVALGVMGGDEQKSRKAIIASLEKDGAHKVA